MMVSCHTVGELINALKAYPEDAPLVVDGADSGGYDITSTPIACVGPAKDRFVEEHQDFPFFNKLGGVLISGELNEHGQDWWDIKRKAESGD